MDAAYDRKPALAPPAPRSDPPVRGEDAANELAGRSGSLLPAAARQSLEAQFDADFSDVRVHTDRRAAQAAAALGTRAFTVGRHIAFDEGQYRPAASSGRRLLAHELAHVVQQRDAGSGRAAFSADAGEEREANLAADRAMQGLATRAGASRRGGAPRIQGDDGKDAQSKPAGQAPAGATITFVLRAPDDAYTQDVTDYVRNTLNETVVEVDNIAEAADYVANYAKINKTKVASIRLIGHGQSGIGGIKMKLAGETQRRFVSPQELSDLAADQKLKAKAAAGMAQGATVEFWGCYVGATPATGEAVGSIFSADFKATDATLRTSHDTFGRPAEKGEKGGVVEVRSSAEIDERVAKGNKNLGKSFNKWLINQSKQLEANGDLPPQPDDAARIAAMRQVFDRSGGRIKQLAIENGKEITRRSDKKWLSKWKTTVP